MTFVKINAFFPPVSNGADIRKNKKEELKIKNPEIDSGLLNERNARSG